MTALYEPLSSANTGLDQRVGRREKSAANIRVAATFALMTLYVFVAPLGNLARFGENESALGLTTVLLTLILGINFLPSITVISRSRILLSLVALACWMAVTGLLSDNMSEAYSQDAGFILYIGFAAAAMTLPWSGRRVLVVILAFASGGLISSLLTLIDWFGIVDVPRVNELSIATRTELGDILQASGPFARRSAMAAYFALLIPICSLAFIYVKAIPRRSRAIFGIAALTSGVALVLTHNRAGLFGALVAIAIISLYLARSAVRFLRVILTGAAVAILGAWLMSVYLPEQFNAYRALLRIGGVASTDNFLIESDRLRVVFFERVFSGLLTNPLGHGYTMLTGVPGFERIDPHNMISQVVWAAGVFGILWIAYFGRLVARQFGVLFTRISDDQSALYGITLVGGLLGWLFCGMAHTIIATGVSWFFFGVLLAISKRLKRHPSAPSPIG